MTILTQVWTDGLGTFQGRCSHCEWRGEWHRKQARAAEEAKQHGADHAIAEEAEEIVEAHEEAAEADAGFDAGEFSEAAHSRALEEELDALAQKHGLDRWQLDELIRKCGGV